MTAWSWVPADCWWKPSWRTTWCRESARDVIAVSTSAHIDLPALLGQPATLQVSLADGTRASFAGEISEFAMLGSEGGLARYRVRISHWIWRLAHVRNSRVWQDQGVVDIIESVFGATSRRHAGAGATKSCPSWMARCRAATAASTARLISPSSNAC